MKNFVLILFKNKKKKKIIKDYNTEKNALSKYNNLVSESEKVYFEVLYENGSKVNYEIALLSNLDDYQSPLYISDDMGRNNKVFVSDSSDYVIKKISSFRKEELIYDWQDNKRITFKNIIETYVKEVGVKLISSLHNKIIIQNDLKIYLFSLKNPEESERFIQSLERYCIDNERSDIIFVRDYNTTQRKWLYELLEKNGFDRSKLYRKYTTFPK